MEKIKIVKVNGSFHFYRDPIKYREYRGIYCMHCSIVLYSAYIYVIKSLQKAKLLSMNYPYLCCKCYKLSKYHARNKNT